MQNRSYQVSFSTNDADDYQKFLNGLYLYNNKVDTATQYQHRLRLNLMYDILNEIRQNGVAKKFDKALDIGCNGGVMCKLASDAGYKEVKGIDLYEEGIARAKAVYESDKPDKSVKFYIADATKLGAEQLYDLIICSEVIEHTGEPELMAESICRLLAPGGVAIVSLPNRLSIGYLLTYLGYRIKNRPLEEHELKQHLDFPFYRTLALFRRDGVKTVRTYGSNVFYWHGYNFITRSTLLNKINYYMGRMWPFKYFSYSLFLVLQKQ